MNIYSSLARRVLTSPFLWHWQVSSALTHTHQVLMLAPGRIH